MVMVEQMVKGIEVLKPETRHQRCGIKSVTFKK